MLIKQILRKVWCKAFHPDAVISFFNLARLGNPLADVNLSLINHHHVVIQFARCCCIVVWTNMVVFCPIIITNITVITQLYTQLCNSLFGRPDFNLVIKFIFQDLLYLTNLFFNLHRSTQGGYSGSSLTNFK